MARADKPYRVYRGGRTKGKVPTLPRPDRSPRRDGRRAPGPVPQPQRRRRRLGWINRIGIFVGLIGLVILAWGVASYLAFQSGISEANERLDGNAQAALAPQEGLLLSTATTVALFGTDFDPNVVARAGARRSDSIMLVRTDPRRGRIAYLSIPRDLRVDVPGYGPEKVNAAFQRGGAGLALRTLRNFTGLPINHVIVVNFADFAGLVDTLGGVTVDVPEPILSNRFDCPYATQARCRQWEGWRFERGEQTMSGRRALVYSRVRENRLNADESDLTRVGRQQQVLGAIGDKITSPLTLLRMPLIGDDLVRPLATDLSSWQVMQLGWRKFRASDDRALHCRLGGTPSDIGGQSFLVPVEENRNVIAMFTGVTAPQPPPPGTGRFGPGCLIGQRVATG